MQTDRQAQATKNMFLLMNHTNNLRPTFRIVAQVMAYDLDDFIRLIILRGPVR